MAKDINITEASVYVGTYAKYNDGSIFGKWLKLSDYSDRSEFYEACAELHSDEDDPEYMFQDYENIPDSLIGECWISENVFEVLEAIDRLSDNDQKAFLIWCDNDGKDLSKSDIDELMSDFENDYRGHYDSEEDFARELVDQREDLSDFALEYFDYEAYARDLFMSSYWSEDGHVFYN
ncbi:antirestriction protein ArdA [Chryseobacterium sp. 2987]|uniref:antirestriction protein ArdA n=1 Tax=Chryseobacterium sp. 2987 TaxID=2817767 RepID=UPI0028608681|nr:antirestriction protein ArdA [Chryseobacterium sp. 2987]MDR6919546.1 antirestriction protein [Chryseobacterium sp. 2987]